MSYTPGQGFEEKSLKFDIAVPVDTKWASRMSTDFEKKFQIKSQNKDMPALADGKISTMGAIIVCHAHLNTYTLTPHYTPEQLASLLAESFDETFRMISFNVCEVARRHDTNAKYLKKSDAESWTFKEQPLTPEAKIEKQKQRFADQFPKGSKRTDQASEKFMNSNYPGWDKKRSFVDVDGTEVDMAEFTIVSRFLRQYVKDKNCQQRVMVAGYDESITAAHPEKIVAGKISATQDGHIGRRVSMAGEPMKGSVKKRFFLAENGQTGITMRVSNQNEWHELFQLPVEIEI
jgi:hypothetical protein